MQITEIMLTPDEFALIQALLTAREQDRNIDREKKEAEGLHSLMNGLNTIKGASGYAIRPTHERRQSS